METLKIPRGDFTNSQIIRIAQGKAGVDEAYLLRGRSMREQRRIDHKTQKLLQRGTISESELNNFAKVTKPYPNPFDYDDGPPGAPGAPIA